MYSKGKPRCDLNASDAVLLPFSDDVGENHLSIGSMVQKYKSDSEKPTRSVGSVARSVVNRVGRLGWVAQVDKNYHIRQELFCPPTSLKR